MEIEGTNSRNDPLLLLSISYSSDLVLDKLEIGRRIASGASTIGIWLIKRMAVRTELGHTPRWGKLAFCTYLMAPARDV